MLRGSTLHSLSVFLIHRKKYSTYAPSGLTISRLAIIDEKNILRKRQDSIWYHSAYILIFNNLRQRPSS